MKLISVNKYKIFIIIVLFFILIFSVLVAGSILWLFIFKVDNKYLSIVNLYTNDITVKLKSKEYKLKAFDAEEFVITTKESFTIEIQSEGKTIKNITIPKLKNTAQLISLALAEEGNECYFSSNLTKLFLDKNYNTIEINTVSDDGVSIIDQKEGNLYLYPGKNLDSNFITKKNIIGVYPIECKYLNDSKKVISTIDIYKTYNASDQRKYFNEAKDRILNAKNLDEFNL